MKVAKCQDCGMPYGGDDWLDTTLPHNQWTMICPEDGILCANCIVKRAAKLKNHPVAIRAVLDFGEALKGEMV